MSFTGNLNLELPAHGDYPDSWEIPANANFIKIADAFDPFVGHTHDGTTSQGPKLDHTASLTNVGTNTHAQIDTHIADSSIHFTERLLEVNDDDFAGSGPSVTVASVLELRFPTAKSVSSPSAGVVVVDTNNPGTPGPPVGVPTHLPTTYSPVAVTDYFNGIDGTPLSDSNWFVDATYGGIELKTNNEAATFSQHLSSSGVSSGKTVNRVKAQVPHSEVQRVTIYVCRVGTDDFVANTDMFSFQLALMSSAIAGTNTISRLGFFLKIDIFKVGSTVHMTRTIYAVPTVNAASGNGAVTVLWTDTGAVQGGTGVGRHYAGSHEFSLDRNHAFHYVYNNGPVNVGAAGMAGAATPFVAALSASLQNENALYPQTSTPIPVAPQYGRFGFDIAWVIPAGGSCDASFRFFTATSTDDESLHYTTVRHPGECGAIPPDPQPVPCCDALDLYTDSVLVGSVLVAVAPSDQPSLGSTKYTVVQRVPDGDATYEYRGFLIKPTGQEHDPAVPARYVACEAVTPGDITAVTVIPPRPGTKGARIELSGPKLPGLIDVPSFTPSAPGTPLAVDVPPGGGDYPQALPYPVPYAPGSTVRGSRVTTPGVWPDTVPVPESVIKPTNWYRDSETGNIVMDLDIGDGLPYGCSFDVTITPLLNPIGGQFTIDQAVVLHPPAPDWVEVRYFLREADGSWTEIDPTVGIPETTRLYIVATGVRLPLDITPAMDGGEASMLWPGFPIDALADMPESYRIVDLATGLEATNLTVHSWVIYKGRYNLTAADLPSVEQPDAGDPTIGFPPTGTLPWLTAKQMTGETAFIEIEFDADAAGNEYVIQAKQTTDSSLKPAEAPMPAITAVTPILTGVAVTPDVGLGSKNVTIYGDFFSTGVGVTTTTPTQIINIDAVTRVSAQEITLTCDFDATGTGTFRVANGALTADISITITASPPTPTISTVSPPLVGATRGVDVTITGTNFEPGALLEVAPVVPLRNVVLTGSTTFDATLDVPSQLVTASLTFTVTNPDGTSVDSSPQAIATYGPPTISSLTFYATNDYGGTPLTDGQEIGKSGWIKITGDYFRAGDSVTSDVPDDVELGTAVIVSQTEIKVPYSIGLSTTVGTVVTITVADPDGSGSANDTFTVEEHTPIITTVNVVNPHEGAGHVGAPAGSARVLVAGRYFFQGGASNIADIEVTAGPGSIAPLDWTIDSDNLITINELVISGSSYPDTITVTITTTNGKTAEFTFDVEQYVTPEITGYTVGVPPLVPIVVEPGATPTIRLYGSNLQSWVTGATTSGAVSGVTTDTINPSYIELSGFTTIAADPVTGDPTVYAVLSLAGTAATLTIPLFQVDSSILGAPAVDTIEEYDIIEGTVDGTIVLNGSNLGANQVAIVELDVNDATMLPLDVTTPVQARIVSQTTSKITAKLRVADLLSAYNIDFTLRLYDPAGAEIIGFGTFDTITVDPFPDRPKFDQGAMPALTTTAGAANTDRLYTLTNATGGESLLVVADDGSEITQSLTDTGSPTTLQVTFTNHVSAAVEMEIRLLDYRGIVIDIHKFVTT